MGFKSSADRAAQAAYGNKLHVPKKRLVEIRQAKELLESDYMFETDEERMRAEELYQEGTARGLFSSPMMRDD